MMGSRMKPEAIVAEIARARVALTRAEGEVTRLREYIGALELAAKLADPSLTRNRIDRIVSTVDVQAPNLSAEVKRAAGRATRKGEAQRMLYEKGWTVAALAKHLGETRPRVSKWFGPASDNRPIPRATAERLQRELGIPLSAWSRVTE
jgi:plasmid maintenance system antidote protein VapI